jgi:hypothetical protein
MNVLFVSLFTSPRRQEQSRSNRSNLQSTIQKTESLNQRSPGLHAKVDCGAQLSPRSHAHDSLSLLPSVGSTHPFDKPGKIARPLLADAAIKCVFKSLNLPKK